jgi:hypothetical protein
MFWVITSKRRVADVEYVTEAAPGSGDNLGRRLMIYYDH